MSFLLNRLEEHALDKILALLAQIQLNQEFESIANVCKNLQTPFMGNLPGMRPISTLDFGLLNTTESNLKKMIFDLNDLSIAFFFNSMGHLMEDRIKTFQERAAETYKRLQVFMREPTANMHSIIVYHFADKYDLVLPGEARGIPTDSAQADMQFLITESAKAIRYNLEWFSAVTTAITLQVGKKIKPTAYRNNFAKASKADIHISTVLAQQIAAFLLDKDENVIPERVEALSLHLQQTPPPVIPGSSFRWTLSKYGITIEALR